MGTDIHFHVEVCKNGAWEVVFPLNDAIVYRDEFYEEYHDVSWDEYVASLPEGVVVCENYDMKTMEEYKEQWAHSLYVGRNYMLFAALAGVRNGMGFAGVDTGDPIKPVAEPRGIPEDVSPLGAWFMNRYSGDGHSHSWLTLQELLDYDWNQAVIKRGVVNREEYKIFKETGTPESWCGDIGGASVKKISPEEMDRVISGSVEGQMEELRQVGLDRPVSLYTHIQWSEPLVALCQSFVQTTIPALQELADNPDDVRIIFFFDN